MSINLNKCISVKNIHEQNIQCPFKRKFGEFCGHHKNGKCIKRFDEVIISNENVSSNNDLDSSKKININDFNIFEEKEINIFYLTNTPFQKI